MLDKLEKHTGSGSEEFDFSVIIPTWNNIDYLKLCIDSINKNSKTRLQLIVLVNEGKDSTVDWLKKQKNIDYIRSQTNIGVCYGVNICRSLVKSEYIIYMNDDMYVLPGWDMELMREIKTIDTKMFMFSSTLIEPTDTGNKCVVVSNYGDSIDTFREKELLKDFKEIDKNDWSGSTWPPSLVHVDLWDLVGGLSTEFSPGMYSDPDFSVKLYNAGVRIFKGLGKSKVYHFGSKSTGRVKKNKGRDQFLRKWGFTAKYFTNTVLNIGEEYNGSLTDVNIARRSALNKIKAILAHMK